MSNPQTAYRANPVPPPPKHQLALMIWVAVFPTLTVLNLLFGDSLADLPGVLRTFVLATVAVPIVIYGLMPRLHQHSGSQPHVPRHRLIHSACPPRKRPGQQPHVRF